MKEKIDYLSTLFVGIDIASRIHVISALDFNQDFFIKMKPVQNSQEGAALLESMIVDVLKVNHQFKYVVIAMESTGFYGVHLANYLSASDLLAPFSVRVYCLNPKEVKNYKKSFNDIGKNDGIDSFVIADFARVGRISIKPWRGSQYLALQRLTRHRMHITYRALVYHKKESQARKSCLYPWLPEDPSVRKFSLNSYQSSAISLLFSGFYGRIR